MLLLLKRAVRAGLRSHGPGAKRLPHPSDVPDQEDSKGKGTKTQHGGFRMLNLENKTKNQIVKATKGGSEMSYSRSV